MLPYERLEVYWLAEEYVAFIDLVLRRLSRKHATDADQLRRAAGSITFNIAEGASDRPRGDRIRLLGYARRSVSETNSIMRRLARIEAVSPTDAGISYSYADRISAMLYNLIRSQ
jgi:four helix bundle protein